MEDLYFKQTTPLQLRFSDIDRLGHLNNSVYFAFFDLGKVDYFETLSGQNIELLPEDMVVASVTVDFMSPVFPHEPIEVRTSVVELGNKSFRIFQRIVNVENELVKCQATTIMSGFDMHNNCAKEIPELWKEAICRFEGRDIRRKG